MKKQSKAPNDSYECSTCGKTASVPGGTGAPLPSHDPPCVRKDGSFDPSGHTWQKK